MEREFGLIATKKNRKISTGTGHRIRFSRDSSNIAKLRSLVLPYMHTCMLYKLGIKN